MGRTPGAARKSGGWFRQGDTAEDKNTGRMFPQSVKVTRSYLLLQDGGYTVLQSGAGHSVTGAFLIGCAYDILRSSMQLSGKRITVFPSSEVQAAVCSVEGDCCRERPATADWNRPIALNHTSA